MPDNMDLQHEKNVRVNAMMGGLIAAVVALCLIVGTAMWYDGWFSDEFGVAVAPSNPAAAESTAASPSGTVGQTPPQNAAPAPAGR